MLKKGMLLAALAGILFVVFNGTAEASALDMLKRVKVVVLCPKPAAKTVAFGISTYTAAASIPITGVAGAAATTISSIALADSSAELGKCIGQKLAEQSGITKPAPNKLK